ncbi:MAG: response regulator transcription factor [Bacteroidota bacterium]|nr:response regulator transcription factor [Bacteroidota bacterium]
MTIIKPRILLAEDDESLAYLIKDNLELFGFEVCHCENGISAFEAFENSDFDLCLFDVMMPVSDGFTLTQKIRNSNKDIPIIFLTAKGLKEDKIKGFRAGADDYMVKPFNMEELIFRIRVFLKRSGSGKQNSQADFIKLGSYIFSHQNFELTHEKATKKLTQKEANLLKLLCKHEGSMVKRETILKEVWGTDDYFAGRSMDVFISKLRKYLQYDASIEIINFHGTGFKLATKSQK